MSIRESTAPIKETCVQRSHATIECSFCGCISDVADDVPSVLSFSFTLNRPKGWTRVANFNFCPKHLVALEVDGKKFTAEGEPL